MSEPNAYNKGLGSLFKFNNKLKQPRRFGKNVPTSFGGAVTPPAPPSTPPPLDTFNQNLVGAYSLRRLYQSYTAPQSLITVCNTSIANQIAISADANGDLDVVTLQAWINSNLPGPFRVITWYDQSPLGSHFSYSFGPPDVTKMPAIADAAGNIYTNNGKPCIKFGINSGPTWLSKPYAITNAKYFVLSDVNQDANLQVIYSVPAQQTTFASFSRGSTILEQSGSTMFSSEFYSGNFVAKNTASVSPPNRVLLHSQNNTLTTATDIYYNGTIVPSATYGTSAGPAAITYAHIGDGVSGDGFSAWSNIIYFKGNMQEIIMYSQPQEIYISGLTANIKSYWGL